MPENNEQNFDEPNQQNPNEERAVGAAAGAPFQTEAQEMKAQRGGAQEDQIVGETAEGAHNQRRQNRNPTGSDAEAGEQGGETF
jgi:hypothetical protein